jgi:antitoxin VapB
MAVMEWKLASGEFGCNLQSDGRNSRRPDRRHAPGFLYVEIRRAGSGAGIDLGGLGLQAAGERSGLTVRCILDALSCWPMLRPMPNVDDVSHDTRRASLFRNGRNQALRIPKAFELPGTEVLVHREGDRLIIEPVEKKKGLLAVLAGFDPLDEEFPEIDGDTLPLDDVRL